VWEETDPVSVTVLHYPREERRAMFPALLGWVVLASSDHLERQRQAEPATHAPVSPSRASVPALAGSPALTEKQTQPQQERQLSVLEERSS
jgi:hypothetical protein